MIDVVEPGAATLAASSPGTDAALPMREPADLERGALVGRYVVHNKLGAGGMGVVFAGYDPDLDRKVALKLLRPQTALTDSDGRIRLVREAQALAKLNHPHIVAIYDVGEHAGAVWLAMEYVDGMTLSAWSRQQRRPWREVLAVMLPVARGLAAAHAAGLVHRDIKPDNIMIGADGRVRVMDLGLARALGDVALIAPDAATAATKEFEAFAVSVTRAGVVLGTPTYMSPEQFRGELVDARADMFSYCVTLWEALYGERPFAGSTLVELTANVLLGRVRPAPRATQVPTWVQRVLERGLAVEPASRWPTMGALLAALDRDPERTRRRWLTAAVAAMVLAGAGYGVAAYRVAEGRVCSDAASELSSVWSSEQRAAVERAIRATGVAYAERAAAVSVERLDSHAARWIDVHTVSCMSHQRGHMSPLLFDRRMACLRQRRSELAATATVLAQTNRDTVAQAVDTARGLPAIDLCEDDERLLAAVAPPEDPQVGVAVEEVRGRLARLQALERQGRHAESLSAVLPMTEEAERLAFVPLRAEVHLLASKLLMYHARPEAKAYLEQTLEWSLAAGVDEVAAEALAVTVFDLAYVEHRPDDALILLPAARGLMRRIGDPPQLVALLHNNAANAWHLIGDPRRAIAAYEEGLALLEAHAPEDPLRWGIVNNLGLGLNSVGDFERAAASARASLPALERQFDPCYVLAAFLRSTLAMSDAGAGRIAEGIAGMEAAIACLGPEFGVYEVNLRGELARLYFLQGDDVRAQEQVRRSEQRIAENPDLRPEGLLIAIVRIDLEIAHGDLAAARGAIARLVAPADDGTPVESRGLTAAELRRALIAHLEGDDRVALEHLQRAEALSGPTVEHDERGLFAFTRARVLRALGSDPGTIARAADDALAEYAVAGAAYAGKLAEIRAWQANPAADR